MFFSFLAFVISVATFVLVYDDGRVVRNFGQLSGETQQLLESVRHRMDWERDQRNATNFREEMTARGTAIREKLSRIAVMAEDGDSRTQYYLENLKGDLEMMREYSSTQIGEKLRELTEGLESARDRLAEDGPDAARRLRDLASKAEILLNTDEDEAPTETTDNEEAP